MNSRVVVASPSLDLATERVASLEDARKRSPARIAARFHDTEVESSIPFAAFAQADGMAPHDRPPERPPIDRRLQDVF